MCSWLGFNFGKTNRGIIRWLAHNSSNPICSKFSPTYQDRLFCTNQTSLPIIAAHLTLLDKRFPVRMNTFLFSSFANRVTKLVSRTTRCISEATVITIQVAGYLSILRLLAFSFIHPAPSCFLFAASARRTGAERHKRCSCVVQGLYRFVSDTIYFIRASSHHFTTNIYENRLSSMFAAPSELFWVRRACHANSILLLYHDAICARI